MKIKDILLGGLVLFSACLLSCQDDELISVSEVPQTITRSTTDAASGLKKNAEGYWVASRRVPLVGEGRMVDDYSYGVIAALANTNGFDDMLDTNLENATHFGGVKVELLGDQIASVRDLNRVYAGGQTVGFVYKVENTKLLTADVLKGFWLKTFLNGVPQETKGGKMNVETLELNLLGAANNNGKQSLSISTDFTKPFDEIKIGVLGITADVLAGFSLYYAFVGDNEEKICIQDSPYFPQSKIHHGLGWTSLSIALQADNLVDKNLEDGVSFGTLGELLSDPFITVNVGKEIPAGSEIGFVTTAIDVLSINLLSGIQLTTYDKNNRKVEEVNINSLLGISAIGGGKSMISMMVTRPCSQVRIKYNGVNVSLSMTKIKYAFVKDPVVVDSSSYFSLSNDVINANSYQFHVPHSGKVVWALKSFPKESSPIITANNKLIGMTMDGDYVLTATYTCEDEHGNKQIITQEVTITRKTPQIGETCDQIIDKESYNASIDKTNTGGGLLEIINSIKGIDNLIDSNRDNYANYANVLSLINKKCLVSIKTDTLVNPAKDFIKTGFVMETNTTILGADVLKFFIVKLYKDEEEVASSLRPGSEAIDVGLVGSESKKMRVGIKTKESFNRIELHHTGLLNFDLQSYKLYYAYWEKVEDNCVSSDPAEACIEMLTPASYGAEINYKKTGTSNVAAVGDSFNNLSYILDSDKESHATLTFTNVIGTTKVAVRFAEMYGIQRQIGFIVSFPKHLVDVSLLAGASMKILKDSVEVAETGQGGLLALQLMGYSDKYYLETTVKADLHFDEVRIEFPAVADAARVVNLYGVYTRRDSNGNGIPDCSEEEQVGDNKITFASANPEHVCYPDPVIIQVIGGDPKKTYALSCFDVTKKEGENYKKIDYNLSIIDGKFTIESLPVGDYYIRIQDEKLDAIHVMVHPTETTWRKDADSKKWNEWNNWDRGIPWECTNVILPSNASNYPYVKKEDQASCLNIHFEPGAELIGQAYLNYSGKAFVDVVLQGGNYQLFSAPLNGMLTGDMFLYGGNLDEWTKNRKLEDPSGFHVNYFKDLKESEVNGAIAYEEQRINPIIYQRFYSTVVENATVTRAVSTKDPAIVAYPDWSRTFNAVSTPYTLGQGFALRIGKNEVTNSGEYTFHFPKSHTTYHYYDLSNNPVKEEKIIRSSEGRLMVDKKIPQMVTLNQLNESNIFLFGNPFMAHLNLQTFLAANKGKVKAVHVYTGNDYQVIQSNGVSSSANVRMQLSPMEAMFVETEVPGISLEVNLDDKMLEQKNLGSSVLMHRSVASPLYLSARVNRQTASCAVFSSDTRIGSHSENVSLLLDKEADPEVAVYTVADGKALSIRYQQTDERIPLGFYMKQTGQVKLSFETRNAAWKGWRLVDSQTGQAYGLDETVTLNNVASGAGRFYLEKED